MTVEDHYLMATICLISFMLFLVAVVKYNDWRATKAIREFEAEHGIKIL